jgi:hypothetical protein
MSLFLATDVATVGVEAGWRLPTWPESTCPGCAHLALATRTHCKLCVVEVDGRGLLRACATAVGEGMRIGTQSEAVKSARSAA